jgi:hypothetical protein
MLDTASFDHKDIDYSLLYSATRRWQRYAQTHPQELAARIV